MSTIPLAEAVAWMDHHLQTFEIQDFPGAWNGLQVENRGFVSRIGAAVDACESVMVQAVNSGIDLLLVHHGLFWQGGVPITGARQRKLRLCLEGNLAVYSSHLPLDVHPDWGNNAVLARLLGLPHPRPFLECFGRPIGLLADVEMPLEELRQRCEAIVEGPVAMAAGGPGVCQRIALVTGGAASELEKVAAAGADTFITGEGSNWTYTAAEELGLNLLYAGHYATETFGVRALASALGEKFGLPWQFLPHPTGR
jgi:dinuclear metal center YbgI/SA1388 family protein